MNIYVVVEGERGAAKVYASWVPLVNPSLTYVPHISEIANDNFSIVGGGGYPQYWEIIDAAIDDVNNYRNIQRLVIGVDSEESSYQEKHEEIEDHLRGSRCLAEIRIVIQHFCLETWALGNEVIVKEHPNSDVLRKYVKFFNVRVRDPELLPDYPEEELNRAQFAAKYLKHALNDKYKELTYSKNNPIPLLHPKYFGRVKQRLQNTGHIPSFEHFLAAFV
jgi:hypothetical protein